MTRDEFDVYYQQHAGPATARLIRSTAGDVLGSFSPAVAEDAVQAATLYMLDHLAAIPSDVTGGYLYKTAFNYALEETGSPKSHNARMSRRREIPSGGLVDLVNKEEESFPPILIDE